MDFGLASNPPNEKCTGDSVAEGIGQDKEELVSIYREVKSRVETNDDYRRISAHLDPYHFFLEAFLPAFEESGKVISMDKILNAMIVKFKKVDELRPVDVLKVRVTRRKVMELFAKQGGEHLGEQERELKAVAFMNALVFMTLLEVKVSKSIWLHELVSRQARVCCIFFKELSGSITSPKIDSNDGPLLAVSDASAPADEPPVLSPVLPHDFRLLSSPTMPSEDEPPTLTAFSPTHPQIELMSVEDAVLNDFKRALEKFLENNNGVFAATAAETAADFPFPVPSDFEPVAKKRKSPKRVIDGQEFLDRVFIPTIDLDRASTKSERVKALRVRALRANPGDEPYVARCLSDRLIKQFLSNKNREEGMSNLLGDRSCD